MKDKLLKRPEMTLLGLACNVSLEEGATGNSARQLVEQFFARRDELTNCINTNEVIGVLTNPEAVGAGEASMDYFIGAQVYLSNDIPEGMVYRLIPENEYVVFTLLEREEAAAGAVYDYLYTTWLTSHSYDLCERYHVEVFDVRNWNKESTDIQTDIYFPIRERGLLL